MFQIHDETPGKKTSWRGQFTYQDNLKEGTYWNKIDRKSVSVDLDGIQIEVMGKTS